MTFRGHSFWQQDVATSQTEGQPGQNQHAETGRIKTTGPTLEYCVLPKYSNASFSKITLPLMRINVTGSAFLPFFKAPLIR